MLGSLHFAEGESKRFYQYGQISVEVPLHQYDLGEDWTFQPNYSKDNSNLPKILNWEKTPTHLKISLGVRRSLSKKANKLKVPVKKSKSMFNYLEV